MRLTLELNASETETLERLARRYNTGPHRPSEPYTVEEIAGRILSEAAAAELADAGLHDRREALLRKVKDA